MNKWFSGFFFLITILATCSCAIPAGETPENEATRTTDTGELGVETPSSNTPEAIHVDSTPGEIDPSAGLSRTDSPAPHSVESTGPTPISIGDSTAPDNDSPTPEPDPQASQTSESKVVFFRSNVKEADPGDSITLEWSTNDTPTVTLWHLTPTGQLGRWWDVTPDGSFDYTIGPDEKNATRFALFATGYDDRSETASVTIAIRCSDGWFFEHAPNICPAALALSSAGVVQHFEGGTMIWVEEEDQIYVLFDDVHSPGWNRFVDQWDPAEPDNDPTLTPPDGLYQPVRGFGLVWREEPGIRDRMGWAVDEESSFETIVQRTSYAKYNETYILAHDGKIWRLHPERSAWEKIAGPTSPF